MRTISAQAGITGRVIDLHGELWRTEPGNPDGGQAKARAACCPSCAGYDKWVCQDCARRDRWVYGMGGYASRQYIGLCAEARETAGPTGQQRYLDMCMARDEERLIDLAAGEEQAAAQRAADAGIRELARRLGAAEAARLRQSAEIKLAADQAAVEACLARSAEIKLTMDGLRADPRVARLLDDDLNGPGLSSAEVTHGLLAAMGLAGPQPGRYEAGDLARQIGIRR